MASIFDKLHKQPTNPPPVEIIEDGFKLGAPLVDDKTEPPVAEEMSAPDIEHNLKNGFVVTQVSEDYTPQSLDNLETLAQAAKVYVEKNASVAQEVASNMASLGQIAVLTSALSVASQKEINRLNEELATYRQIFGELPEKKTLQVDEDVQVDTPTFAPVFDKEQEATDSKPKVRILLPSQVMTRLLTMIKEKFPVDNHTDYGITVSSPDFDAKHVAVIQQSLLAHTKDILNHVKERAEKEGLFFTNNTSSDEFGMVVYTEKILLLIPNLLNIHQHTVVEIETGQAIKFKTEAELDSIQEVLNKV